MGFYMGCATVSVKGKNILHPHEKTKFFILLGTAFLSLAAGTYRVVGALGRVGETAQQALKDAPMGRARPTEQLQDEPAVALGVLMILAGLTLAAIAWKMWREIG